MPGTNQPPHREPCLGYSKANYSSLTGCGKRSSRVSQAWYPNRTRYLVSEGPPETFNDDTPPEGCDSVVFNTPSGEMSDCIPVLGKYLPPGFGGSSPVPYELSSCGSGKFAPVTESGGLSGFGNCYASSACGVTLNLGSCATAQHGWRAIHARKNWQGRRGFLESLNPYNTLYTTVTRRLYCQRGQVIGGVEHVLNEATLTQVFTVNKFTGVLTLSSNAWSGDSGENEDWTQALFVSEFQSPTDDPDGCAEGYPRYSSFYPFAAVATAGNQFTDDDVASPGPHNYDHDYSENEESLCYPARFVESLTATSTHFLWHSEARNIAGGGFSVIEAEATLSGAYTFSDLWDDCKGCLDEWDLRDDALHFSISDSQTGEGVVWRSGNCCVAPLVGYAELRTPTVGDPGMDGVNGTGDVLNVVESELGPIAGALVEALDGSKVGLPNPAGWGPAFQFDFVWDSGGNYSCGAYISPTTPITQSGSMPLRATKATDSTDINSFGRGARAVFIPSGDSGVLYVCKWAETLNPHLSVNYGRPCGSSDRFRVKQDFSGYWGEDARYRAICGRAPIKSIAQETPVVHVELAASGDYENGLQDGDVVVFSGVDGLDPESSYAVSNVSGSGFDVLQSDPVSYSGGGYVRSSGAEPGDYAWYDDRPKGDALVVSGYAVWSDDLNRWVWSSDPGGYSCEPICRPLGICKESVVACTPNGDAESGWVSFDFLADEDADTLLEDNGSGAWRMKAWVADFRQTVLSPFWDPTGPDPVPAEYIEPRCSDPDGALSHSWAWPEQYGLPGFGTCDEDTAEDSDNDWV